MLRNSSASETRLSRELSATRARLADQERQIQELNHRIANSLQLAADLLTFEQLRARDPHAQSALEASRARLVAVGALHRYLHDHADRATVELRPFLDGLCEAVRETTGLACEARCDSLTVTGDMAQKLAIAINELAINAAKHAYQGQPGGRLTITARRTGSELTLTVADAGKGLEGPFSPGKGGLGMTIVAALVRDLRGTLVAHNDDGAAFTIRAPLPAPVERSFRAWAE